LEKRPIGGFTRTGFFLRPKTSCTKGTWTSTSFHATNQPTPPHTRVPFSTQKINAMKREIKGMKELPEDIKKRTKSMAKRGRRKKITVYSQNDNEEAIATTSTSPRTSSFLGFVWAFNTSGPDFKKKNCVFKTLSTY